jgi:hypothetical protein
MCRTGELENWPELIAKRNRALPGDHLIHFLRDRAVHHRADCPQSIAHDQLRPNSHENQESLRRIAWTAPTRIGVREFVDFPQWFFGLEGRARLPEFQFAFVAGEQVFRALDLSCFASDFFFSVINFSYNREVMS